MPLTAFASAYACIAYDRREAGHSGGRVERLTWAAVLAHDTRFAEQFVQQDVDRYLALVTVSCHSLSGAAAPAWQDLMLNGIPILSTDSTGLATYRGSITDMPGGDHR